MGAQQEKPQFVHVFEGEADFRGSRHCEIWAARSNIALKLTKYTKFWFLSGPLRFY